MFVCALNEFELELNIDAPVVARLPNIGLFVLANVEFENILFELEFPNRLLGFDEEPPNKLLVF